MTELPCYNIFNKYWISNVGVVWGGGLCFSCILCYFQHFFSETGRDSGNLYPIYPLFPCSDLYVPPGMTGGTLCFRVVRLSILSSVRPSFRPSVPHVYGVPLCLQRPAKTMPFQQIIMHALQCQHDLDVHLLFCVDLDLHITSSRGCV